MSSIYVFIGKPGSGKGTQAKLFAEKLGLPLFNTSTELKTVADNNPPIDAKIEAQMERGELVPYWLASFLWQKKLLALAPDEGLVIEGALRVASEAKLFHEVMEWLGRSYTVIDLVISDSVVLDRITKRAGIEHRSDDTRNVVAARLKEYEEHTVPSLTFFEQKGVVVRVNGEPTVEEIQKDIVRKLHIVA